MIDVLLPHPELRPYIRAYMHSKIDFQKADAHNFYYFTPTHTKFIMLYLGNPVKVTFDGGHTETKKDMIIVGPQTKPVNICFEQNHRMIAVELHSTGQFYLLDKCPIHTLINCNIDGDAVFGNKVYELTEKLTDTLCLQHIKSELDAFFREKLRGAEKLFDRTDFLLNHIPPGQSIGDIASSAGISVRQFERLCKEKIGVSPLFYNKLRRFAQAYKLKELFPQRSWTDIAYSCGYYDQMHLIRDFRLFAGHNPRFIDEILNQQYRGYTDYIMPE